VNSGGSKKDCEGPVSCAFREKRNGLEPSPAELRARKFIYLPLKSKALDCRERIGRRGPSLIGDYCGSKVSVNSRSSGNYFANRITPAVAEMKKCARNIPEARLIKYNACITRRDGMQDKCDALSRKALKKCCWK
jgi:hypothetical protein